MDVNDLSSSSKFLDLDGSDYQSRTAWAGQGTGVLVLDADGDGKISRSSEFAFTEWDGSATSDLEALKNVFDTNGNGKLDAGDARWADFKVDLNGQLVSLDSVGITSIDLTPTGSGQSFADGSAVTGTTTFTRADGTTGTVGDAVLAADSSKYIVQTTSSTNADGSIVRDILAYNPDGSLAFRNVLTTSADGNAVQTQFDDDGNGTIDRTQTSVLAVDANGVRTKTVSNFNADGSLADRTTTATSADKLTITTTLDQNGDGSADERQTVVKHADGSSTTTTQSLSVDGTVLTELVIDASADGLTKTSTIDLNGDGTNDEIVWETTVVAGDSSRTKTVADRGADGTLLSTTVTLTSADNKTRTVSEDADGNGTIDTRTVTETAVAASSDITAHTTIFNGDSTLRGESTSVTSASGLSKTVSSDLTGDGVVDLVESDITVVAGDGTRTQTVQQVSADGTQLTKTVTMASADGKTITISTDINGDSATDSLTNIIVGADGTTTKTVSMFNADGSLITRTVGVTSVEGLSKTTSVDADGNGTDDRIVTDVIVTNADGSRTETITTTSANGAIIGKTVTTTTADSLSQTVQSDLDGDGSVDQVVTDTIMLGADGARTETVAIKSADGTLQGQSTTVVSADRKTTTVTTDADGDGHIDAAQTQQVFADGHTESAQTDYAANGAALATRIDTVSADALTTTSTFDFNGDGIADRVLRDQTTINADGSRTEKVTLSTGNGTLLDRQTIVTSGNGLSVTTSEDINGDGVIDLRSIETTTLNSDGSVTKAVSHYNGTTFTDRATTTVSANGLSTQTNADADGDGTFDRRATSTRTLNADGSTQTTDVTRASDGTLISKVTTNVSADSKTATKAFDLDGNGGTDVQETITISASGTTTDTIKTYKADGSLASRSQVSTSDNGLSRTSSSDRDGDGVFDLVVTDKTTLNANGGQTRTLSEFGAGNVLTSRTTTTVSADGLTKTATWADGTGTTVRSSSDVTVLNADGGTTETLSYFGADGSLESRTIAAVTAHRLSTTVITDLDGDGAVDQRSITTKQADGSVKQVLADLASDGIVKDTKTITVTADGLQRTVDYDSDGNGTVDKETTSFTVLNADGSKTTTVQELVSGADSLVVKNTTVVDTSADGLSISIQWDTTGTGSFDKSQTDVTVLNADGSRTRTISTFNGASLASRHLITTSANGRTITEQWDLTGSGSYDQMATDVTVFNADGTTTRTISSSKADGTLISRTVTTSDASGKVIATTEDRTGFTNLSITDTHEVLADGAIRETLARNDASGHLIDKTTVSASADKRTVTVDRDANGDSIIDQRQQTITANSGIVTAVTTDFNSDGSVRDRSTRTVSADGRHTTIAWDFDGDGDNDRQRDVDDTIHADGSRTTVTTDTNLTTGLLAAEIAVEVSADGRVVTTTKDVNGDGTVDQMETFSIDPTGASLTVVTNNATARDTAYLAQGGIYWKQAIAARSETTNSLDGRTSTIEQDYDGDGVFEITLQSVRQIDGSIVTTVTETDAASTIKASGTIATSAEGLITKLSKDSDNNGTIDHTETAVTHADGSVTLTKADFTSGGSLTQTVVDTVNTLGSLTKRVTSDGLGRKTAQTDIAADGSALITTFDAASGQTLSVSRTTKAGLLTSAIFYDPLNAQTWIRVEQQFDAAGKKASETQYKDDGTRAEVTFHVATGAQQKIRYVNAAGVLTDIVEFDVTKTATWSQVTKSYNAAGQVTVELKVNDNGTKTQVNFDTAARKTSQIDTAADGSTVTTAFDAASGQTLSVSRRTTAGVLTSATLYDPLNSQAWMRVEQQFDAAGKKTLETQYKDDGTRTEVTFHVASGAQQKIRYFDAAGVLTDITDFDVTNAATWSQTTKKYNAAGQALSQVNVNDDGTKVQYTFDPTNAQTWSTYQQNYNAAGTLTFVKQTNDNGTRAEITFTTAGAQRQIKYYDASNVLTGITDFDVTSANTWSQQTKGFDAAGRTTSLTTINDNGTQVQILYDADSSKIWKTYTANIDAAGKTTFIEQINDDNSKNTITYDVANNQAWSRYERTIDSAGRLVAEIKVYDNGTKDVFSYDAANAAAWAIYRQNYNAAGVLAYVDQTNDSGTHNTITYDAANNQSWIRYEDSKNTNNQTLTRTIFNDNGTKDVTTYDVSNGYINGTNRVFLGDDSRYFMPIFNPISVTAIDDFSGKVTSGDYNGDGRDDIMYSSDASGQNRLFFGKTDGSFTSVFNPIDVDAIDDLSGSVTSGDFNGDGRDDLMFAWRSTGQNRLFFGKSDGSFTSVFNPINVDAIDDFSGKVTSGDYNGDGRDDLMFAWSDTGTNRLFFGKSDGSFTSVFNPISAIAINDFSGSVTSGDYNGDGRDDIMFAWSATGTNRLFFGKSDGSFTSVFDSIDVGAINDFSGSVTSGDYNGDGRDDLMFAWSATGQNRLFFGNSDGSFTSVYDRISSASLKGFSGGGASGDYNGDGYDDLIYRWANATPPALLDLNGDGHIDLRPFDPLVTDGPAFDWDGDGERDATAWVGPADGFLAIDLGSNGEAGADGLIDQARELAFANWVGEDQIAASDGQVSDLDGLRLVFDSNHDNILDAQDDRWSEFRVWRDANQNGATDQGELQTMSEAGIKLVNLLHTPEGTKAFADGSAITGTSSYETEAGGKFLVGDATLAYRAA